MFLSFLVYAGLFGIFLGLVSLVKPLRWLRIRTRARGSGVLAVGVILVFIGVSLPAPLHRVAAKSSRLDEWMPEYQFAEFHSIRVHAAAGVTYRAFREVTADEIFLFRTLTWIRNPHWPGHGRENLLNPPEKQPILDVAVRSGFRLLSEEPGKEIVLGSLIVLDGVTRPNAAEGLRAFLRQGNALATINFRFQDDGAGWCTVTTETRVFATDDTTRQRFSRYWRVIYPGSWLIRYFWLRALRRRAEIVATRSIP